MKRTNKEALQGLRLKSEANTGCLKTSSLIVKGKKKIQTQHTILDNTRQKLSILSFTFQLSLSSICSFNLPATYPPLRNTRRQPLNSNCICYSTKSHRSKWAKLAEFTYQAFSTVLEEKAPEAVRWAFFCLQLLNNSERSCQVESAKLP